MKDNVSSAKLKGTVLFTVVSVLMVLIVFLMGTLALAATASNRAYGNYQKEQTEYTARAVLDSVVQAINEDHTTNGIKYHMASSLTSQSSNPLTVTVDASDGLQATVSIANAGTRQVYSETQGTWVNGTVYELSTTIDRTLAGTTYRAYIIDEKLAGGGGGGGGGGAFVSLGGVSGKIGTSGFTAGGTEIGIGTLGDKTYEFDNASRQMAPFYVHGSLVIKSQTTMQFNKVGDAANKKPQFIAVTGDLTLNNNFDIEVSSDFEWPVSTVDYTEVPSLYVGGTLKQLTSDTLFNTNMGAVTSKSIPMNVYCGNLLTATSNAMSFRGDLYAFNSVDDPATPEDDSITKIYNQNYGGTLLYQWINANATISNNPSSSSPSYSFGNLFSAGSVELGGPEIEGDIRVEQNLSVEGKHDGTYGLNGNVVVGGTLKVNDNYNRFKMDIAGNLYADKLELTSGADPNVPTILTCYGNIDINDLVVTGGNKVEIRCDNIKIKNYTHNPNVVLKNLMGAEYVGADSTAASFVPAAPAETEVIKKAGLSSEGIYPTNYTEAEVKKKIITVPSATQYDAYPSTLAEFEATLGSLSGIPVYTENGNNGTTAVPPEIVGSCVLDGGFNKDIRLKPNGTMVVVIENVSMTNKHDIIIDDSHGEVFFFITGSLNLDGGYLITKDYEHIMEDARHHEHIIKEVQPSSSSKYYPNVYIFADEPGVGEDYGATLNAYNDAFITAHVRAPGLKFDMNKGMQNRKITYQQVTSKVDTNGDPIVTEYDFSGEWLGVIGQLICGNISVTNDWGMLYVTLPSGGCACCAKCTGTASCTCKANGCSCASCTCGGGGGGNTVVVPDKFATMYYNYF